MRVTPTDCAMKLQEFQRLPLPAQNRAAAEQFFEEEMATNGTGRQLRAELKQPQKSKGASEDIKRGKIQA